MAISLCLQMLINFYLNVMVVYLRFIVIHFYHNQNEFQFFDFFCIFHRPYRGPKKLPTLYIRTLGLPLIDFIFFNLT